MIRCKSIDGTEEKVRKAESFAIILNVLESFGKQSLFTKIIFLTMNILEGNGIEQSSCALLRKKGLLV